MKKFELILKNEKEKFYRMISWIIIVTNLAFFIYMSAATGFTRFGPLFYVLLVGVTIFVPRYFRNPNEKPGFFGPFFIISMGWFNSGYYWWVGIIVAFFMIFDGIASRPLVVKVFADKIIYPSWPKKEIGWNELNNVILKDDLFTIDFKNDKLIQQYTSPGDVDNNVDEKEFNQFCNDQINIKVYSKEK